MIDEPPNAIGKALARLEHDIANLKGALGLLGVKPCSSCGKFYLGSSSGNLFICQDDAICYECLSGWWQRRCGQLGIPERASIEHSLMRWLITNHDAKVYRALGDLPPEERQAVRLIVACYECKGSGRMAGERCRHCLGNCNVWVVTLK